MALTQKEIKQRYFDKVYNEAPTIPCACGCGELIKSKDKYGRNKKFISGHNGRIYDDPKQFKREWNHRNRESRYLLKQKSMIRFKRKLIILRGGKCSHCEYILTDDNHNAFDFHHIDESTKEFNISNSFNRISQDEILKEFKKCEILCANCHRIHHYKQTKYYKENNSSTISVTDVESL